MADAMGELASMAAGETNAGTNGPVSSGIRMECAEGVGAMRVTMAADNMRVTDVLRAVGLPLGLQYRRRHWDYEEDAVTLVVMRKPDGTFSIHMSNLCVLPASVRAWLLHSETMHGRTGVRRKELREKVAEC